MSTVLFTFNALTTFICTWYRTAWMQNGRTRPRCLPQVCIQIAPSPFELLCFVAFSREHYLLAWRMIRNRLSSVSFQETPIFKKKFNKVLLIRPIVSTRFMMRAVYSLGGNARYFLRGYLANWPCGINLYYWYISSWDRSVDTYTTGAQINRGDASDTPFSLLYPSRPFEIFRRRTERGETKQNTRCWAFQQMDPYCKRTLRNGTSFRNIVFIIGKAAGSAEVPDVFR